MVLYVAKGEGELERPGLRLKVFLDIPIFLLSDCLLIPAGKFPFVLSTPTEKLEVKVYYKAYIELVWIQCLTQVNFSKTCA